MKKIISAILTAVILISCCGSAFAKIANSDYWMNTTSSLGNFLINPVYEDDERPWVDDYESFIIVYYSTGCYYSQQMLPTFADYAENNKIKTFAINYNESRGFMASKLLNKMVLSFPIVVVFNGDTQKLYALDEVRTKEKFNTFVSKSLGEKPPHITLTIGSNQMTCDGEKVALPVPATIVNGRTMVPMRAIYEALGAEVEWYQATKLIRSTRGPTTIDLRIGSTTMTINGKKITLDVAPQLINNTTMVPVRAVSEALNRTVTWNNATRTVDIR